MWGDMSLWNDQGSLLHSGDHILPCILTVDYTFKFIMMYGTYMLCCCSDKHLCFMAEKEQSKRKGSRTVYLYHLNSLYLSLLNDQYQSTLVTCSNNYSYWEKLASVKFRFLCSDLNLHPAFGVRIYFMLKADINIYIYIHT